MSYQLHENEILRAFRTVNDSYIEPVSFIVPRRAEAFQNDIYPPATGTKPAMSGSDWFDGAEARLPPKINLADVFDGEAPKEVAPEKKVASTPMPTHTQPESAQPAAAPVVISATPSAPATTTRTTPVSTPTPTSAAMPASRGAPTSMKDNKDSIASMASRFADAKDDDASSDDDGVDARSGFDEVDKPVERPSGVSAAAALASVPKPASMPSSIKSIPSSSSLAAPEVAGASTEATGSTSATSGSSTGTTLDVASSNAAQSTAPPRAASGSGGPAEGLKAVLSDIRGMLEAQGKAGGAD